MPLDNYGFSARFGWCSDRFGVSWQLQSPVNVLPGANLVRDKAELITATLGKTAK